MSLTEEQMLATIKDTIASNKIAVFMKGTPAQPRCGFSAHTQWPTLPQVFVGGKLIGGCDIVREMMATGELDKVVAEAIR